MASASIASPRSGVQGLSHGAGRPAPVLPLVTIIMPLRHEARYSARALPAVLVHDYPADNMETVVVDGMAKDGPRAIVTAMAGGEPRVQCMDNPERIVPTALNRGVRAAHGEIIICVDGHAVIAPDSLRRCVETLAVCPAPAPGLYDAASGVWPRVSQGAPVLGVPWRRGTRGSHEAPLRARAAGAQRRSPEAGEAPEVP